MNVQDYIQFVVAIVTVWFIFSARSRLRINPPKVRVALGLAGILIGLLACWGFIKLLPGPEEIGPSAFLNSLLLVPSSAISGLFALSLLEIVGGSLQALKRRRDDRRSVR